MNVKENPKILVLAYSDDVSLSAPPTKDLFVIENLKATFITIRLDIADHKCEISHSPTPLSSQISSQSTISTNYCGSAILGIPIEKAQFIKHHCVMSATSGDNLCKQMTELQDIQSAMLLLTFCHILRINHLARSVIPDLLKSAADLHDFNRGQQLTHYLVAT